MHFGQKIRANPIADVAPATVEAAQGLSPYQRGIVAILALLQFTVILDFMILSPLGAILMPELAISPSQFALVVSIYAFSAGVSGVLAAGFADRFDRKRLLLFFYTGFLLGTLGCGIAESFTVIHAARKVCGIFGGVIGSIVFAITTDLFPFEVRGRVMSVIQTAFAVSQVLGMPLGLWLATHSHWHTPFLAIVGFGAVLIGWTTIYMQPVRDHLETSHRKPALSHLVNTLRRPRYAYAFAATALLSTGGFMLMPFGSAFSVHNLGIPIESLPLIYIATGLASMIAAPVVGRFVDKVGAMRVFAAGSAVSLLAVLTYTNLGRTPLATVIVINSVLFISITSRIIASSTLLSTVPDAQSRGAFMAVNASAQQISGGFASVVAGAIVAQNADGSLEHFDRIGLVVSAALVLTTIMMVPIHRRAIPNPARGP